MSTKSKLVEPLDNHLVQMMGWFSNQQELADWSGPNFRYPFDFSSFVTDLKLSTLRSFSLVSNESEFLAFGQYYQRLGKCHLGRLIVNPKCRGKGIASALMHHICELGLKELKVKECSLFVLTHNENAIKAYKKFGFTFADYPQEIPLNNCLYMVKL
jgi:ribosomal protein S18 acetylase RimI-like enzyme